LYLVNRYYDPATGQFISVDPALAQTNQPYGYAGDDPVNESDPTGLYNQLRVLASASAFGYDIALNQVTTGRSRAVKPGMVRIQFEFTAVAARPVTQSIVAAIRDQTRGAGNGDATYAVDEQPRAHPSVLAYPGDLINALGVAVQFDGTQTVAIGYGYAPNVKVRVRGSQFPTADYTQPCQSGSSSVDTATFATS